MAINWQIGSVYTAHSWKKIVDCGNNVLILTNKGSVNAKSTDGGKTFQQWTAPILTVYDIAVGGGMVFIVGMNGTNVGAIAVSTDNGTSWVVTQVSFIPSVCCWAEDRFLLAQGGNIYAAWTTDGKNLNTTYVPVGDPYEYIIYANGIGIIPVMSQSYFFITKDKGATWQKTTVPKSLRWSDIKYGNGKFVLTTTSATTGNNIIMYSSDGENWTVQTLPYQDVRLGTCIYDGYQWVFAPQSIGSTSPTDVFYTSNDLVNFTEGKLPFAATRGLFSQASNGIIYLPADFKEQLLYYTPNAAPLKPATISVPNTIMGGKQITISWSASTDSDGNLSGYILQRSVNGGEWTQIYKGSLTSYTDTITSGWQSVNYRVQAYDALNEYSDWTTKGAINVINNTAPTISGTDGSLGTMGATFTDKSYVINDTAGDTVTVTERFDGVVKRTFTATLGSTYTFTMTAAEYQQVLNGAHTITVTAVDQYGATTVRTWTFTKAVNTAILVLSPPLAADAMPKRCVVGVNGAFPSGSILTVEVCNNANDASPTWEDVSAKLGKKHYFNNTTKTATAWAVGLRVTLNRNNAVGEMFLNFINMNFD